MVIPLHQRGTISQPLNRCPLSSPGSRSGPSTAGAGRTTTTPTSTTSTRGTPSSTRRRSASTANTPPRSSRTWRGEPLFNRLLDGPLNQCPLSFRLEALRLLTIRLFGHVTSTVYIDSRYMIYNATILFRMLLGLFVFCFTGLCCYFWCNGNYPSSIDLRPDHTWYFLFHF